MAVKQHPAPVCVAGQSMEMLVGECLRQGGKGFSLGWEELGMQGSEEDADSCTNARA